MSTYRDPFTLEEAMREIRANRKRVESQASEIERLKECSQQMFEANIQIERMRDQVARELAVNKAAAVEIVAQAAEIERLCAVVYLAASEQSEPVATTAANHVRNEIGYCWFHAAVPNGTKLYTAAPQPAELTDEEIKDLWSEAHDDTSPQMPYQTFARAVLAAQKGKA